jgi:hypothetical protein
LGENDRQPIRLFFLGRYPDFADRIANAGAQACILIFRVNHNSVTPITKVKSKMEHGFPARIIDRVAANARVIRRAPEAVALIGIIVVGVSYVGFQNFHRERVAALNDTIASQERLLANYRTKLKGATPEEAAAQIEKLTRFFADARKSLITAKSEQVTVENRSRDPHRLYDENKPIALVRDPKIELDKKKITFLAVNAEALLGANKTYEFQDWKVACGGTQLYSITSDGSGSQYSYSPFACKIVGSR